MLTLQQQLGARTPDHCSVSHTHALQQGFAQGVNPASYTSSGVRIIMNTNLVSSLFLFVSLTSGKNNLHN